MPGFKFLAGPTYKYNSMTYYAMNGFICIEDDKPGLSPAAQFTVITCRDFLLRARALSGAARHMGKIMAEMPRRWIAQDRDLQQRVVMDMLSCLQDAKAQGDFNDPEVWAWVERHKGRRSSITVDTKQFSTPPPGPLPRGRFTGRTAKPDKIS